MKRYGHALWPESEGGFHDGDCPSALSLSAPVQGEWASVWVTTPSEEYWSTLNHRVCWPCQMLCDPE